MKQIVCETKVYMKKLFRYLLELSVLWFTVHTLWVTTEGLRDDNVSADAALILGNTVNRDGKPSPRLKARLDRGLKLYKDSLVRKIVVTGGLGKEGFYEAEVMKHYLVTHGANANDVLVDNNGNTSILSVLNYKEMKVKNRFTSVVVVTQFFHIVRMKMLLHQAGINKVYSAHADYYEWRDLYSLFREFFAYYYYRLKLFF